MNNHARPTNGEIRRTLLNLQERKSKKLQVIQAYSKLYYETRVKAVATERWVNRLSKLTAKEKEKLPENPPLAFRNAVAKELYETESDDVKAAVEEFRNDPDANGNADEVEDMDEEAERVAKANAYQR
jgi:hypothetical protein